MIKDRLFTAEELRPGIWQITNYFDVHRMLTYCYLIEGKDRALLIDTMFGYGNLKKFCEQITDLPITLVNTHYHGDHTGGNFDFDECYMHALDIPFMHATIQNALADPDAFVQKGYERMKNVALDEYKDSVKLEDTSAPHQMSVWPVWDGDIFDLGDRHIQVIHVGGHTPGELALLSLEDRFMFAGDSCNTNTLICFAAGALSVEEYLQNLYHYKEFQPLFDEGFGAHEPFFASNIDEGIELCKRVLAGTDDHEEAESFRGKVFYGAQRKPGTFIREDGKRFNVCYIPETIHAREKKPQVIK